MKAKNIHLSEDCVKYLSIKAIENGTNFKNYVEGLLEKKYGIAYIHTLFL